MMEESRAVEALNAIPPDCDRDTWVRALMAAHAAGLPVEDVEAWSAQAPSYTSGAFRDTWRSIKPGKGIGPGTLYRVAAEHGWRMTSGKKSGRTRTAQKPIRGGGQGVGSPDQVWSRCELATESHEYIQAKQGIAEGLRVVPSGDPLRVAGESMAGALVVPVMRADGTLSSLQLIVPDATAARLKTAGKPGKLNLPGASLEGWFTVGTIGPGGLLYVCEGIGAAWSCWKATGRPAVVAFGWGRVRGVAQALHAFDASARLVLVPDVGKEMSAMEIAQEVSASVALMPQGWPENSDVNDLAQRDGLDALELLLSEPMEPPKPAPRYKLLSTADLLALPPMAWRIRGVLPAVGLAGLYGPSASGKSFLALDMAAAIANGARWFDHRTEAAPVVYAALEGEAGFRLRAEAWEVHKARSLPNALHMMLQPFKLTEPADVRDLAAVVPHGAVMFLDTLNRAAPTSDENSSKDMGEILENAKALQKLTGGLVVLVHHSGKDTTKGLRGHSSLFAALDAALEVSREGERREWRVAKAKDGADGDVHSFRLQVETLGADEYGDPITSCVVVTDKGGEEVQRAKLPAGGNQRLVLEALRPMFKVGQAGKPGAPPLRPCIELEAAVVMASGHLTCETHRRNTRAREAITGLVGRGVLACQEGWLWQC
jgi:putative DNA primase/helicase